MEPAKICYDLPFVALLFKQKKSESKLLKWLSDEYAFFCVVKEYCLLIFATIKQKQ
jgi:hypothetical protein